MDHYSKADTAVTTGSVGSSDVLLIAQRAEGTETPARISVITPVPEDAEYLRDTIASILAQRSISGIVLTAECSSVPPLWVIEARIDALRWRLGYIDETGADINE